MSSIFLRRVRIGSVDRSRDIGRVVNALEELPEGKGWRVTWEECKSERSLQQNKLLWAMYGQISEKLGYEKSDIHDQMLRDHFGVRLKKVPKCRDYPDGWKEVPIRTTTRDEHGRRSVLGKVQFSELVEYIKRWAAEGGVYIHDSEDYASWKEAA